MARNFLAVQWLELRAFTAGAQVGSQVRELRFHRMIPSVRRLVWAGKHQLGNAAWGASFPSERALPAGGFGSVHTPSP